MKMNSTLDSIEFLYFKPLPLSINGYLIIPNIFMYFYSNETLSAIFKIQ